MADWATIASVGTAAGTMVLGVATFASVRSAQRAARVAERSLLVGLRPVLMPSRASDPIEPAIWGDGVLDHPRSRDGADPRPRWRHLSRDGPAQRGPGPRGASRLARRSPRRLGGHPEPRGTRVVSHSGARPLHLLRRHGHVAGRRPRFR